MKKTEKLKELMAENPEMPVRIFVNLDAEWSRDNGYSYEMGRIVDVEIGYRAWYNDELWLDEEDYEDQLEEDISAEFEDKGLEWEDYKDELEEKVRQEMDKVEFEGIIYVTVTACHCYRCYLN